MTDVRSIRPPWPVVVLLSGVLGYTFVPVIVRGPTPALVGREVPDLSIAVLSPPDAKPFVLREQRGKVVVLELCATWSDVCDDQQKILDEVMKEKNRERVAVLGIVMADDRKNLEAWLDKHHPGFPVALDEDGGVAHALDINNVPSYVIVAPSGAVASVISSGLDASELGTLIDRAR